MKKKAIILDLDNTIYPVASIGDKLFHRLFALIENNGSFSGELAAVKTEIMRRPFQQVAHDFSFSNELKEQSIQLLTDLTYEEPMQPFEGYDLVASLPQKKFLVTTGFTRMQQSKIRQLGIEKDFENIYIIDPAGTKKNKKDIFETILSQYLYNNADLLVVGDDINSEIRASQELGIDPVLFDYKMQLQPSEKLPVIYHLKDLLRFL